MSVNFLKFGIKVEGKYVLILQKYTLLRLIVWLNPCCYSFSLTLQMKRKLDHGSEVRSFSLGKKPCKVSEYTR